jgi:dihydropyrimidinase
MKILLQKSLFSNFSTYLLKNARIVNPDLSLTSDLLIEDGKITNISENISHKTATVIDCTNKLAIPGGIDTHTHMQLPFMGTYAKDDFDTGTKAALAGGTTSFIDFAIPNKGETPSSAFNTWRNWADPKVNCDYGLHSALV